MTLTTLFINLREHLIASDGINFAEVVIPWDEIAQLCQVEFDGTGNQIKSILSSVYTDGISGLENVQVEGDKITGIFLDTVNPQLTKRYEFTIDENNIIYKLLNPGDIDQSADYGEISFTKTQVQPKKCVKGTRCGNSCINKDKACRKVPPPEEKKAIKAIVEKGQKTTKATITTTKTKKAQTPSKDPRIHSIQTQKDFEDAVLHAYSKLDSKGDNLVPIFELRRALGETVPRDKFDKYMFEMQGNDIFTFKAGYAASGNKDEMRDSLRTSVSGARTLASLDISKDELKKRLQGKGQELDKLLDNPPPLDNLGTARELEKGAKINNSGDFTKNIDEAYNRLESQFKYGDLVPINKLRESLGDRVSASDFDKYIKNLVENDKYQTIESNSPSKEEEAGAYKTSFGVKHFLRKIK